MKEQLTIQKLQEKIWYRLIKVIFIFFLLIFVVFDLLMWFEEGVKLDKTKTKIFCNFEDKKTFMLDDINLYLPTYYFFNNKLDYKKFYENSYNENKIKTILKKCYPNEFYESKSAIYVQQKSVEMLNQLDLTKKDMTKSEKDLMYTIYNHIRDSYDKTKNLNFSVQLFDIKPNYNYLGFVWSLLWTLSLIIFIFEIIRRIFYYIILGKFFPKKEN
jgi:hypothetical protein